jgi:Bacterial nucleoid DNA-binding protein
VPAIGFTIARRLPVIRLKSVDFPTFGRPTSTTDGVLRDIHSFTFIQLSLSLDSVSVRIYSIYQPSGDPKHDQGRHRQRSVENRDITKVKAEVAVDAVFDAMRTSMQRGERIELRGFGVFQVKPRKRGIGRNPRTGKEVRIPPGRTIRFKPGKDLQNIG